MPLLAKNLQFYGRFLQKIYPFEAIDFATQREECACGVVELWLLVILVFSVPYWSSSRLKVGRSHFVEWAESVADVRMHVKIFCASPIHAKDVCAFERRTPHLSSITRSLGLGFLTFSELGLTPKLLAHKHTQSKQPLERSQLNTSKQQHQHGAADPIICPCSYKLTTTTITTLLLAPLLPMEGCCS